MNPDEPQGLMAVLEALARGRPRDGRLPRAPDAAPRDATATERPKTLAQVLAERAVQAKYRQPTAGAPTATAPAAPQTTMQRVGSSVVDALYGDNGAGMGAGMLAEPIDWLQSAARAGRDIRQGDYAGAAKEAAWAAAPGAMGAVLRKLPSASSTDRIADALAKGPAEGPLAGTRVLDEAGQPKRVFHGTPAAFDTFDMERLDRDALAGPGLYFTESPEVAGGRVMDVRDSRGGHDAKVVAPGYAQGGGGLMTHLSPDELRARIADRTRWLDDPSVTAEARAKLRLQQQADQRTLALDGQYAPNVRPARLGIRKPLDLDKAYTPDELRQLAEDAPTESARATLTHIADYAARNHKRGYHGSRLREDLMPLYLGVPHDGAGANAALADLGFDGITHIGGGNTGTAPHRVWIAFDRAQVRSAFDPAETARQVGAVVGTAGLGAAAAQQQREKRRKDGGT